MAAAFNRDDKTPLTGPMLALGAFMLALANFMAILDTTIANVSVPNIAGGLAISPSEGTWVITSYSVAEAITVPLSGWLAARFGAVRVFCTAVVSFGICSALCGVAPSLGVLVLFRVLQGFSGGPLMPLSQTLMMRIFPPEKRGTAMGLWSMTAVVGPIAGPLLGGVICDNASWPWIFYINVPVAAVIFYFASRLLPRYELPLIKAPVDFLGLGLLVVWVGALQIMLDKGEEADWFNSPTIVLLAVTAAVGFAAFLIWELTHKHPIVALRLFAVRAFATCSAVMALTYGAFFGAVVLIPLWLQTSMGYNALWSGRVMAVQGVLAVLLSPVVGANIGKTDPRRFVFFGVMVIAAVMFIRAGLTTQANFWAITIPQIMLGAGMPFFFIGLNTIALGAIPPEDTASGSGILNFLRTTAGAFAVSLTTTSWSNASTSARVSLAGRLNSTTPFDQMQTGGMGADQARLSIDLLTQQQAVMLATDGVFTAMSVILVIAACSIWLAPRPAGPVTMGSGGGH
jgi:MFS transporter, DHA2 family, multidrug resistance protein